MSGITVYTCQKDEESLFRKYEAAYGLLLTITEEPVSVENAILSKNNCCISINHKSRITIPVLDALHHVGVSYISTRSIGCDHIDLKHAVHLGIRVENVAYSPDSVADHALMLMLMLVRRVKSILRNTDVQNYTLPNGRSRELRDMTVGVLGIGRIGKSVIARLSGFGCKVLAYDCRQDADESANADYVSFETLLAESDILTLHIPLTPNTRHILSRESLAKMKKGAFIVNTGRGALIDTKALVALLESGRLGGAALDVVEGEEDVFYHDLRGKPHPNHELKRLSMLSNTIITPHTAFFTEHALWDTVENTIKNCLVYQGGKNE